MIQRLFQILFPSRCLGCGKESEAICDRCITLTRKTLSAPLPYIVSSFDFKDPLVKQAIHALKYYHRKDLVGPLVAQLARDISKLSLPKDTVLVPIPMPKMRKLFRGYNQSTLIAQQLQKKTGFIVEEHLLSRTHSPHRQAKIKDRATRLANPKGSFIAHPESTGRTILLIDDVATTGATLEEARKVLLRSGAYQVFAATLAH